MLPFPAEPDVDRPPRVTLPAEQAITIDSSGGVVLEACERIPEHATRAVVLCHPHPVYGGTMHNAIVVTLAKHLGGKLATLRFNFRGVEGSSGCYEEGEGEVHDVLAALQHMRKRLPQARISVAGYSFGSWVALRAAWCTSDIDRVALIAPAMRVLDYSRQARPAPCPCQIVVGDDDQFVGVDQAHDLGRALGAQVHVIEAADHFFVRQRRTVANTVAPFVAPELGL